MESRIRDFHRYVEQNDLEKVQQLLESGVNADEPNCNKNGRPALIEATYHGFTGMIKLLLDSEADPNAQNMLGETALHNAFHPKSFSKDLVCLLLDRGADVDIKEKLNGCTALHSVVKLCGAIVDGKLRKDVLETLRLMCDKGDVNVRSSRKETPLHRLVCGSVDWIEPIQVLVDYGVELNAQNERGETGLMCAIDKGHCMQAETLIKRGVNVNIRDKNNQTALHHSAQKNMLRLVSLLLDAQCDLNAKDLNGDTALHIASSKGLVDMAQVLVSHTKINVDVPNLAGLTPLQTAVESGFTKVVELLLEGYCDIENEKGLLTALDVAEEDFVRRWHPEILDILQEALAHKRDLWDEGETSL